MLKFYLDRHLNRRRGFNCEKIFQIIFARNDMFCIITAVSAIASLEIIE